jgi:hypothetical protein
MQCELRGSRCGENLKEDWELLLVIQIWSIPEKDSSPDCDRPGNCQHCYVDPLLCLPRQARDGRNCDNKLEVWKARYVTLTS